MSFGQDRTKKTKTEELDETLGFTTTFACEPAERGLAWARPLYRPAFKVLDASHLEQRTWLR